MLFLTYVKFRTLTELETGCSGAGAHSIQGDPKGPLSHSGEEGAKGEFNWCLPLTNGELQGRHVGGMEKIKPDPHQRCTAKQHKSHRLQQGHFKQIERRKWAVKWLSTQKRVPGKWGNLHPRRHSAFIWTSLWAVLCCQVHLEHNLSKGPLPLKLCCKSIFLKLWGFCFCCLAEILPWKVPSAVLKQGHAPVTLSQFWKDKNP